MAGFGRARKQASLLSSAPDMQATSPEWFLRLEQHEQGWGGGGREVAGVVGGAEGGGVVCVGWLGRGGGGGGVPIGETPLHSAVAILRLHCIVQ